MSLLVLNMWLCLAESESKGLFSFWCEKILNSYPSCYTELECDWLRSTSLWFVNRTELLVFVTSMVCHWNPWILDLRTTVEVECTQWPCWEVGLKQSWHLKAAHLGVVPSLFIRDKHQSSEDPFTFSTKPSKENHSESVSAEIYQHRDSRNLSVAKLNQCFPDDVPKV